MASELSTQEEQSGNAVEATDFGVPERFAVTDAGSANWVVRRILEARRYRARVEEWAAAEIRRAERQEAFFLARYGLELEEWARDQLKTEPRRKSLNLPAGTIGFRTEANKLVVTDEPKLLAWCQTNLADAIRTEQRVLRGRITEHVKNTGEVPEGTDVTNGGQRFYVR